MEAALRDVPILMSAPMIGGTLREIDEPGTGKWQTRRLPNSLKGKGKITELGPSDTPGYDWHFRDKDLRWHDVSNARLLELVRWHVGDRLWIKESWAEVGSCDPGLIVTRADYPQCVPRHYENVPPADQVKWRVSIHMPRRFSRLTLTVTDVRVERLNDISEADALAEGVVWSQDAMGYVVPGVAHPNKDFPVLSRGTAREMYAALWDVINGSGAWLRNEWVVVVSFKPERRNIDA